MIAWPPSVPALLRVYYQQAEVVSGPAGKGPLEAPHTYVFMERYVDQAAVEAHRATDYFKALGRKMGEFMDGRAEVLRLREVE